MKVGPNEEQILYAGRETWIIIHGIEVKRESRIQNKHTESKGGEQNVTTQLKYRFKQQWQY